MATKAKVQTENQLTVTIEVLMGYGHRHCPCSTGKFSRAMCRVNHEINHNNITSDALEKIKKDHRLPSTKKSILVKDFPYRKVEKFEILTKTSLEKKIAVEDLPKYFNGITLFRVLDHLLDLDRRECVKMLRTIASSLPVLTRQHWQSVYMHTESGGPVGERSPGYTAQGGGTRVVGACGAPLCRTNGYGQTVNQSQREYDAVEGVLAKIDNFNKEINEVIKAFSDGATLIPPLPACFGIVTHYPKESNPRWEMFSSGADHELSAIGEEIISVFVSMMNATKRSTLNVMMVQTFYEKAERLLLKGVDPQKLVLKLFANIGGGAKHKAVVPAVVNRVTEMFDVLLADIGKGGDSELWRRRFKQTKQAIAATKMESSPVIGFESTPHHQVYYVEGLKKEKKIINTWKQILKIKEEEFGRRAGDVEMVWLWACALEMNGVGVGLEKALIKDDRWEIEEFKDQMDYFPGRTRGAHKNNWWSPGYEWDGHYRKEHEPNAVEKNWNEYIVLEVVPKLQNDGTPCEPDALIPYVPLYEWKIGLPAYLHDPDL